MAKLEHLHRILKIFDGMQLTQVVDKLFSDYDGEICNVDRAEDIRLCHKKISFSFTDILVRVLWMTRWKWKVSSN